MHETSDMRKIRLNMAVCQLCKMNDGERDSQEWRVRRENAMREQINDENRNQQPTESSRPFDGRPIAQMLLA